jgi:hypothetical protein
MPVIEYSKYDTRYMRENPTHKDEIELAELEAEREANNLLSSFGPNFSKRVLRKLAPKVVEALDQDKPNDDDTL